jgi:DMATS type aromatic prenyltransferase
VARLDASELGDFGTLRTLRDAMTTTTPLCDDVAVSSQAFIAWDLAHDGTTATKVYFMPHARAKATGMSNLEVVDAALRSVGMDECAGWQATKSYIASLEVADRPEVLILSTDCVAQGARFKVYLRYPTSEAEEIAQHLSLGGASFSGWREPLDQVFAALGLPTSIGPLNDSEHLTGGTLLYAEFTATSSRPSSKVYLPVRHWPQCSDASVAEGIGQLVSQWSGSSSSHGLDIEGGYPAALASLFPDR